MGTMLCWCAGALRVALGWLGESTTRSSGTKPGDVIARVSSSRSSSYVKSCGSVLGEYGLKSMMCPRERSRVSRKSKVSARGQADIERSRKDRRTVAVGTLPLASDMLSPELLYCFCNLILSLWLVPEAIVIWVTL